jgi:hypothetical protein
LLDISHSYQVCVRIKSRLPSAVLLESPSMCYLTIPMPMHADPEPGEPHPYYTMCSGSLLLAGLAWLAPSVVADWLETTWVCDADLFVMCGPTTVGPYSHFHTDFGSYHVYTQSGCHSTSIPGMTDFCIDWGNSRAHFKFSGQNKRCLRNPGNGERFTGNSCPALECWRDVWTEVPCTWDV